MDIPHIFPNTIYILVGPSGSGKSTLAKKIDDKCFENNISFACVSADKYFDRENGYVFKPSELSFAHDYCKSSYAYFLHRGYSVIVVDNTNTTKAERYFYERLAALHNYQIQLIYLPEIEPEVLAERNIHGVPLETIKAQIHRINKEKQ